MDPRNMSLDEIIHFRFHGNQTGSVPTPPGPSSLTDLSLDEAIPILRARRQQMKSNGGTTKKRPYEMTQTTAACLRAPIQKIRLRNIDPLANSLEDIIEEGEEDDDMKNPYKPSTVLLENEVESSEQSHQNKVTGSEPLEYPEYTPYRAVSYLARKGMPVTILVGQLKNSEYQWDQSHKWRCIISSGSLEVMADSSRKQVARDMAAVEFLEQLAKLVKKPCKIPKYTVLPEVFIDPRIFHKLEKAAIERTLDTANYVKVRPVKVKQSKRGGREGHDVNYLFVATFLVGKAAYKGESYVEEYAKLLAAKRAYEGLTGTEVPPIKYFTGDQCDPTLEYDFGESEISQSVIMNSQTDKIPRGETSGKPMRKKSSENFKKFKTDEEDARSHMPAIVKPEP